MRHRVECRACEVDARGKVRLVKEQMSRLRKKEDALRAELRKKDAHIQRLSNTLESTTHARTQARAASGL